MGWGTGAQMAGKSIFRSRCERSIRATWELGRKEWRQWSSAAPPVRMFEHTSSSSTGLDCWRVGAVRHKEVHFRQSITAAASCRRPAPCAKRRKHGLRSKDLQRGRPNQNTEATNCFLEDRGTYRDHSRSLKVNLDVNSERANTSKPSPKHRTRRPQ